MSRKRSNTPSTVEPAPIYLNLRNKILTLAPQEAGILPSPESPNVWGVLMETGYPHGVATLVSLADGTTSLYFSSGGGIIGAGQHPVIAQASRAFVAECETLVGRIESAATFPLPKVEKVRFYILTFSGTFTAEADEHELGQGQHSLSALFCRGQEVITQIRLNAEHASTNTERINKYA